MVGMSQARRGVSNASSSFTTSQKADFSELGCLAHVNTQHVAAISNFTIFECVSQSVLKTLHFSTDSSSTLFEFSLGVFPIYDPAAVALDVQFFSHTHRQL